MATRRIRLHKLLNHDVLDTAGRHAGRIEEVRATVRGGECLVEEYLLGSEGLLERLSIADMAMLLLRPLGGGRPPRGHHVPWHQMDLSDPDRPRLRCTIDQLKSMQPPRPRG